MGYDRLARPYPWLEWLAFGDQLARARTPHLERLRGCRWILLMGDGVGASLEGLLRRIPDCSVHSVDISAAMLTAARRRLARHGLGQADVLFERADVEHWSPPRRYDAVVTPFFLDLFEEERLTRVVDRLADAVSDDGHWLMSDFRVPGSGWRRIRARSWLFVLYRFFRLATAIPARRLEDPHERIQQRGFALLEERVSCSGLLTARHYVRGCDRSAC